LRFRSFAAWDKSGASAATLQQALVDPSDAVRWSAINTLEEKRVHSDSLKHALFGVLSNPNEMPHLRLSAASALEQYVLSEKEYRHFVKTGLAVDEELNGADEIHGMMSPTSGQAR